jgi:alkylation response protein AidB-like acyl-CoA dehydrogenase
MSMSLSLSADERLLAETIERFCLGERITERARALEGAFASALWQALCEVGYLELARPDSGAGFGSLVAMVEVLGHHAMPGPLSETVLALALADDADAAGLLAGKLIAGIVGPGLLPAAGNAQFLLEIAQDGVFRVTPGGAAHTRDGLGVEAWATAHVQRGARFEGSARGLFAFDLALAVQLPALAQGLLQRTAEHAATRKQFGKTIGAFQAVSHPLADAHIALTASAMLGRAAAAAADEGDESRARAIVSAALLSAQRSALAAVYTCHQKLGALGITLEGPAHHVSRRVRSLATLAQTRSTSSRSALLEHMGALP